MMGTRLTCVACGASSGLFDVHCTACGVELQPRPTEEQLDSLGLTVPDEGHWESGTTRGSRTALRGGRKPSRAASVNS